MVTRTWEDLEKGSSEEPFLLPVGSFEQHGYHAPLATDSIIVKALADSVTSKTNAIRGPCVPVGVSDYHGSFTGTLWVPPATLKRYLKEIVESMGEHGFDKIIFVNGHGGNQGSLHELSRDLRKNKDIYALVWTWFRAVTDLIEDLFDQPGYPSDNYGLHADAVETSVLMAIDEKLVDQSKFKKSSENGSEKWYKFKEGAVSRYTVDSFSESGVAGRDLKHADPEKGEVLLERSEEKLSNLVEWVKNDNEWR